MPRPAAKISEPSQSRCATQDGTPRPCSRTQKNGPIGKRYPMFWWVTVPIPIPGSHIESAAESSRPGSRKR